MSLCPRKNIRKSPGRFCKIEHAKISNKNFDPNVLGYVNALLCSKSAKTIFVWQYNILNPLQYNKCCFIDKNRVCFLTPNLLDEKR